VALQLGESLVEERHLVAADWASVGGVEDEDHRTAAQVGELQRLSGGAGEREVGRQREASSRERWP
jgi:hypothetical protein